jgi:hypothetical protein
MDQGPMVTEEFNVGAKFLAKFEKRIPVMAAFWLKANEEASWYLYVASDAFNDKKLDVGHREVLRLAGEMRNPNLDPFRVKLIGTSDPLAKRVLDILGLYPGWKATPIHRRSLDGVSINEVYIYPTPTPVS